MAENLLTKISSKTQTIEIGRNLPTVIIGERINPTGRKILQKTLLNDDFSVVREDAVNQVAAGATVLDVNAGVPDADEAALLEKAIREIMSVTDVPLCIDTANPDALAAALKVYEGKPLINSVNGEERSLESMLPLVKESGAAVIGLCMDDKGIPTTPEARLRVAARIIERAGKIGIDIENIVIDPLVLTMGADSNAGTVTLKTIEMIVAEFGVNITMGASNVSFGMPDREYINAAFLAMSIQAGLTCPITNPLLSELTTSMLAADLVMGKDDWGMRWINAFRARGKAS
jgi:5-methyltetrahydrofolate--homocysteine methyltransferase